MKRAQITNKALDTAVARIVGSTSRVGAISTNTIRLRLQFAPEVIGHVHPLRLGDSLHRLHKRGVIRCRVGAVEVLPKR